jgi:hypothetical protein
MKICLRLLIVLFLLVIVVQARPAQRQAITPVPACPCSVEIAVKRLFLDEPIPGAEVSLFRWETADSPGTEAVANTRTQFTSNDGNAIFRYLEQGRYTVFAKRDGFSDRSGEAESSYTFNIPEPPVFRTLEEGTSVDRRITLSLVVTGAIVGTLQYANGDPAAGISIVAVRVTYSQGQRVMNGIKIAETAHENGEYRLGPLPDGQYYLRTDHPYSPVYFPGTFDPDLALPVILRDGHQTTPSDFKLPQKGGVTISGTITVEVPGGDALPDDRLLRSIRSLYLIRRDGLGDEYPYAIPNTVEGNLNRNGGSEFNFEIHNVSPGAYDLYPVFVDTATTTRTLYFTGKTILEVGTDDIRNIHASVHPHGEVSGRVTVIDDIPVTATRSSNSLAVAPMQFQFNSVDPLPQQFVGSRIGNRTTAPVSNGAFRIEDLVEGKYAFASLTLAGDFFVSEMRQGARDFTDDGTFDIQSGVSEPIDIVVRSGGGAIHGSVQIPKSGFGVLMLIPDPPRRQNRSYYRGVRILPTGNFDLTGIAPGTYKLFAWDAPTDGAESDPKFLEQFETRGVRVTVAARSVLSDVRVPLILNTN